MARVSALRDTSTRHQDERKEATIATSSDASCRDSDTGFYLSYLASISDLLISRFEGNSAAAAGFEVQASRDFPPELGETISDNGWR